MKLKGSVSNGGHRKNSKEQSGDDINTVPILEILKLYILKTFHFEYHTYIEITIKMQ